MRNKTTLLVALFFVIFYCDAQEDRLYAELNYNTFSHSNLKSFQDEFVADVTDVQLVKNDEFPANIGFTVGYILGDANTALFISYTSTGGKVSYSDYSGVIRITESVSGITVGGEYLVNLNESNAINGDLNLGLRGFMTYSSLEVESYSGLNENIETSTVGFNSTDFGVGVKLIYEYPIAFFYLRATLGFDAVLGGKYLFKENSEYHLEDNSGDPVKNGWSGIRTGLGISIPL